MESVISVINFLSNQLPGILIGAIGIIIVELSRGYVKIHLAELERQKKHKLEVVRQVLKICNEAFAYDYIKTPRDREHVISVLTDLYGLNKSMGDKFDNFISTWETIVGHALAIKEIGSDKEAGRMHKEMIDDIEENRAPLVDWCNRVRTGNEGFFLYFKHKN